ncbi:MAG: DUF2920 family protein [Deltaproteobacteria bacterium]|nr:DUF2920 family protein [Deltaproteobacteria bacterium]
MGRATPAKGRKMNQTIAFEIIPPKDVELEIEPRTALKYLVTFPDGYRKTEAKGLIFAIPGYGDHAESDYQCHKLRPYLANKYDSLVVGVRYHNDMLDNKSFTIDLEEVRLFYDLEPAYFSKVFGVQSLIDTIFSLLVQKGISGFDYRLGLMVGCHDSYPSFGFLPALDHLSALADLTHRYLINKNKVLICGSSYGGFIGMLMGKFAPKTFSVIIDNSGFCVTKLDNIIRFCNNESQHFFRERNNRKYFIPYTIDTKWTLDETSPFYFSENHKRIRSLLEESHRVPSDTIYCIFHSVMDKLIPVAHKDTCVDILNKYELLAKLICVI